MLLLLVGVPLLLVGQVQKEPELRGAWLLKAGSLNGESIKPPPRAKLWFIFGDDKKLIMRRTGEPDRVGKFSIGEGVQTKHIDVTPLGEDEETSLSGLGIFKLDDNCLVFAMASERVNGKDIRPIDFDGQKRIALFRLEKIKPDAVPKINTPLKSTEKSPALAGRWELIPDEKSKESLEIKFGRTLFGEPKELLFRRKVKGSFLGLSSTRETTIQIPWVKGPEGRKNVFALVEKINEKKEGTVRLIRYYFRGETLELLGQASPGDFGTINLTGEWRRATDKTK